MTKRIFRTILGVAVCMFLASALLFLTVLYDYFSGVQQAHLKTQLMLASQGVSHEGAEYFEDLDLAGYRITWIDTDGGVLYDSVSDPQEMENHFAREEVKQALSEGYGESSRYSSTLTQRYLYSAKRLPDGTVLRLSVTQSSLFVLTLGMLQPICVVFAVALLLSTLLASRLSKKIADPINHLDLDVPLQNHVYEELTPLLRRLDIQQRQIRNQESQLKRKQNEFETLTKGMTEGIVLLDGKGFLLSSNPAADRLFHTDKNVIGKHILSVFPSPALSDLLTRAENGTYAETSLSLESRTYRLTASPVAEDDVIHGIVLLLLDVTEKESLEKMRREFTANVSHELKTPLHTISGCGELLANGMVKPEDIPAFSNRIYAESQRMIRLVEDIISLSHLDEGAGDLQWEDVDLTALAEKTIASLSLEAEKADVEIKLEGETAVLYGIPQLLGSIVYNLCDNAIKYNREGGSVMVSVKEEEDALALCVADTGIGIPAEDQSRIFERFYRVDKSHSREIGGTGLGLSIVKHAARLHGAAITVDSTLGKGTTITVRFPKPQ